MRFQLAGDGAGFSNAMRYIMLSATGVLIILLFCLIQNVPSPPKGEYYYSTFIRRSFTGPAKVAFVIIGFLAGYFWSSNPWLTGISLFSIFPVTSIIEATVYPGSHNLIPFEFAVYFIYALPSIIAVYAGRFIFKQVSKQKGKHL